jgi:hypothetical protein
MKITKYDRGIMRYNLFLNLERIPVNNEKDRWMHEFSKYLLDKLFKMERQDMEKEMLKTHDFEKHEYPNETIYYLKKRLSE